MSIHRTVQDLPAESKTLWYEFSQLCGVAERLRDGAFRNDPPEHNALVESFAIHCRTICHFFFAGLEGFQALQRDDLGAISYDPDWKSRIAGVPQILVDAKKACDKQVAHMTGERRDLNFVAGQEYNWPLDQIERELREILNRFLEFAPSQYFDPKVWTDLGKLRLETQANVTSSQQPSITMTAKTCPPFDDHPPVRASSFGGVTD